jgi:hypothetical protein
MLRSCKKPLNERSKASHVATREGAKHGRVGDYRAACRPWSGAGHLHPARPYP